VSSRDIESYGQSAKSLLRWQAIWILWENSGGDDLRPSLDKIGDFGEVGETSFVACYIATVHIGLRETRRTCERQSTLDIRTIHQSTDNPKSTLDWELYNHPILRVFWIFLAKRACNTAVQRGREFKGNISSIILILRAGLGMQYGSSTREGI